MRLIRVDLVVITGDNFNPSCVIRAKNASAEEAQPGRSKVCNHEHGFCDIPRPQNPALDIEEVTDRVSGWALLYDRTLLNPQANEISGYTFALLEWLPYPQSIKADRVVSRWNNDGPITSVQ